jgi:FAD synthase
MQVPSELPVSLPDGIYAAKVTINTETYGGALFYGPIPVFGEKEKSLEVYLVDSGYISVNPGELITVDVIKFIRDVQDFSSAQLMVFQMEKDVTAVRAILEKI